MLALALALFALSPTARAVTPAPDGGYPNGNTAEGDKALLSLTADNHDNTAIGFEALRNNNDASDNTAIGSGALESNTAGNNNRANGDGALNNNTTGHHNTADGVQSLQNNTSGSFNIGLGNQAGRNLTTGSNNIDIGNRGVAAEAKTIRIGEQGNQNRTFIAGIFGATMTGSPVVVNSAGKLGVSGASSARLKEAIKPMNKASEAILALKPVTFRYKQEIDPDGIP